MPALWIAALVAATAVAAALPNAGGWSLKMLHAAAARDGAVCLDGTAPGYYIRPGAGADAANFKIHFKGVRLQRWQPFLAVLFCCVLA